MKDRDRERARERTREPERKQRERIGRPRQERLEQHAQGRALEEEHTGREQGDAVARHNPRRKHALSLINVGTEHIRRQDAQDERKEKECPDDRRVVASVVVIGVHAAPWVRATRARASTSRRSARRPNAARNQLVSAV